MKTVICGVIISIFCSAGCVKWGEGAYAIRIQNNGIDTIQFYASYVYPDTSIANQRPKLIMAYPSTYSYWSSKEKWESILPFDTISIYILSKDTVDKYSWELIKSGNRIMKRYDLSIGDLKKLGWEVAFPPTEAVKNIKQFPPY